MVSSQDIHDIHSFATIVAAEAMPHCVIANGQKLQRRSISWKKLQCYCDNLKEQGWKVELVEREIFHGTSYQSAITVPSGFEPRLLELVEVVSFEQRVVPIYFGGENLDQLIDYFPGG
jgi:hypothetical protein